MWEYVCVCVLTLCVILKHALNISSCHSGLLGRANKISHEYAVITCKLPPLSPCPVPVCVCFCLFALRAIDVGSVNPILSTSLQEQDIIHKTNTRERVTGHKHTHVGHRCTNTSRPHALRRGRRYCCKQLQVCVAGRVLRLFPTPGCRLCWLKRMHTHTHTLVHSTTLHLHVHKHADRLLPLRPLGDVRHSPGAATAINLPGNEKSSVKQPDGTTWHAATRAGARAHTHSRMGCTRILYSLPSHRGARRAAAGCQSPSLPLPRATTSLVTSLLHCHSVAPPPPPSMAAAYPCRSAADVTAHQLGEQWG